MKQKNIFLASEGNAWFERNAQFIEPSKFPESDSPLVEILGLGLPSGGTRILEVGLVER